MGPRHRTHAVCLPTPAPTRQDVIGQFLSWAQANPKYDDEPAPWSLVRFMHVTWPCGKKAAKPAGAEAHSTSE
jgi:hypothetical protein